MKRHILLIIVFIGFSYANIQNIWAFASNKKKINNTTLQVKECSLKKTNQKVSVTNVGEHIRITISPLTSITSIPKEEIVNDSFIMPRSNQCPAEGFRLLSCNNDSFTIVQQLCSGWYFVDETFGFNYSTLNNKIYLNSYKRKKIDRRFPEKEPVVKEYFQDQFGEVLFQDVNREFLMNLINMDDQRGHLKINSYKYSIFCPQGIMYK